jgi:general secretion pathway protein G
MRQIERKRNRSGFTLVEILLVLVILTTLAAIVVPKFSNRSKQAKETAAQTEISNLEVALDAFEVDNGHYPESGDGLKDLVEEPSDADNWRGPYMKREVESDPWGEPYNYEYPGKHNKEGYDLWSTGPDKQPGGGDDIINWTEK